MKRPTKNLILAQRLLKEALDTQGLFKSDKTALEKGIADRKKQIDIIQTEQLGDTKRLYSINGGLAVLQHLITKYKQMMYGEIPAKEGEQK